jgi:hypothetical protein
MVGIEEVETIAEPCFVLSFDENHGDGGRELTNGWLMISLGVVLPDYHNINIYIYTLYTLYIYICIIHIYIYSHIVLAMNRESHSKSTSVSWNDRDVLFETDECSTLVVNVGTG